MNKFLLWLKGIAAGFVSGGAGSITAAFGASYLAPDKFNLAGGMGLTFKLMGICFLLNGIIGAAFYLKKSPLPGVTMEAQ